jgi:hypothetical protein
MIDTTPLSFEIFKRLFPFKPTAEELARFPELEDRYKPFIVLEIIPFFAFSGIAWYLWYHTLLDLEARQIAQLGPSIALITPTIYYWMILSLFLGMISSAPLLHLCYKALLRDTYPDYVLYNNMRVGFDTWKMVRRLALVIVPPVLLLALLGTNTYMIVTETGMTVNPFCRFNEQHHLFSDVQAVKLASHFRALNGKAVARPHFVFEFNDGTKWTTRDWLREVDPENDAKLAAFIAKKSRKKIQAVEMDE